MLGHNYNRPQKYTVSSSDSCCTLQEADFCILLESQMAIIIVRAGMKDTLLKGANLMLFGFYWMLCWFTLIAPCK